MKMDFLWKNRGALGLIFLLACQGNQTVDSNISIVQDSTQFEVHDSLETAIGEVSHNTFSDYVRRIALVRVGDHYSCERDPQPLKLLDNSFTPEGASVLGRMPSIGSTHFIIFLYPADVILPVLEVYNDYGEKLNEVQLLRPGNCLIGEDNLEHSSEFTVISEYQIVVEHFQRANAYNGTNFSDTLDMHDYLIN